MWDIKPYWASISFSKKLATVYQKRGLSSKPINKEGLSPLCISSLQLHVHISARYVIGVNIMLKNSMSSFWFWILDFILPIVFVGKFLKIQSFNLLPVGNSYYSGQCMPSHNSMQ